MKTKLILCLWSILCLTISAPAQSLPQLDHCHRSTSQGFFYFDENTTPLNAMFTIHRDSMLRHPMESVSLIRSWTDPQLQMDHLRYQQFYDGARVEGAEFTAHGKNGSLTFANGKLAHHFPHGTAGTLSEADALTFILAGLSGPFAWQDSAWLADLQADLGDPNATYYPQGELLWALDRYSELSFSIPGNRYRLAWKFSIATLQPFTQVEYYADAFTGEVFKRRETAMENGPAQILTQGQRTIDTQPFLFHHILHATDGNRDIRTKYFNSQQSNWGLISNITDNDDDWGTDEQLGTTAHWMVTQAWDYFENRFGIAGMADGRDVRVYADWNEENAQYTPDTIANRNYIYFGTLSGQYLAVLDIAGHEYTHGLTENTARLAYESESGALNESFSDIFGFEVEAFAEGIVSDWLIGEDAVTLRSMENPNLYSQPILYLTSAFWVNTVGCVPALSNDWCGVHTNSGVQNYWFYLLSQGGSVGSITINGIGHETAAFISYWSLTNVLQSSSQYPDAREAAIATAGLFWGACSNEQIQTTNAWAAVDVGDVSTCNTVSVAEHYPSNSIAMVYPNPVVRPVDKILVKSFPEMGPIDQVEILNLQGQPLATINNIGQTDVELVVSEFETGIYLLKITSHYKHILIKFVIQ